MLGYSTMEMILQAGTLAISSLAPLANRIEALRGLGFEQRGLFNIWGGVAALSAFVVVIANRQALHRIPPAWVFVALAISIAVALLHLSRRSRGRAPSPYRTGTLAIALVLYSIASASFCVGVTKAAAERFVYRSLSGQANNPGGVSGGLDVFLQAEGSGQLARSRTQNDGRFRFLLTVEEARQASRVSVSLPSTENPRSSSAIDWRIGESRNYRLTSVLEVP